MFSSRAQRRARARLPSSATTCDAGAPPAGGPSCPHHSRHAGPASRELSRLRNGDCEGARRPRAPSERQRSDSASCRLGSVPPPWARVRRGLRSSRGTANGGARDALRCRYALLCELALPCRADSTAVREHSSAKVIFRRARRRDAPHQRKFAVRPRASAADALDTGGASRSSLGSHTPWTSNSPPSTRAFRKEFRDWLAMNLPPDLCLDDASDDRVASDRETFERRCAWQRAMHAAGWVGITWPRGTGDATPGSSSGSSGTRSTRQRARPSCPATWG